MQQELSDRCASPKEWRRAIRVAFERGYLGDDEATARLLWVDAQERAMSVPAGMAPSAPWRSGQTPTPDS